MRSLCVVWSWWFSLLGLMLGHSQSSQIHAERLLTLILDLSTLRHCRSDNGAQRVASLTILCRSRSARPDDASLVASSNQLIAG
jgi:hypothetical protein